MGLFSNKPKVEVCDMCGKSAAEGCGSVQNHVVEIRGDDPAWLPPNYRAEAHGEFTWLCTRCNSFPEMKWPKDSGAWAGLMMHLGSAHHVGQFKGTARQQFEMTPVR
jgi:hypothetical protein